MSLLENRIKIIKKKNQLNYCELTEIYNFSQVGLKMIKQRIVIFSQYSIQQKMQNNVQNLHSEQRRRRSKNIEQKQINKINSSMECKLTKINSNRISSELRINKWRYQTDHPIFKVYHYSYEATKRGNAIAKIVYELPQKLLDHCVNSVSLPNCLYILKTVLLASEKLIQEFGYFKLSLRMIGITAESTCKIWVNQNLYLNQVMYKVSSEEETVESIKKMIEKLHTSDQISKKFIRQMNSEIHNILRFTQFIWKFSYENSILVPPFFAKNLQNKNIQINSHKKTKSLLPSPLKLKTNISDNKSQQGFNMQNSIPKQYKVHSPLKKNQEPICFREKLISKLNKSSHVSFKNRNSIVKSEKQRENSKSDFLQRKSISKKESYCSTEKQNLTKTTTSKVHDSLNQLQNQSQISQENKMKMKTMIKQKLRKNRQKKKVVRLQAINTVKSIGQFTESEKKIIEQSNKQNNTLQILNEMCKKIEISHFHIELPHNSDYSISDDQTNENV